MTEEQIDVVDTKMRPTGQSMGKNEVHKRELWHRGAHVWVYNSKGQILLQLRHPDKKAYPNTWDVSAAGHLSAGDDPVQGGIRETKEEIGLDIVEEEMDFVGVHAENIVVNDHNHKSFNWTFLVHRDVDIKDLVLQPDETAEVKWVTPDELEQDVREHPERYAPRERYVYDIAIAEIRRRTKEKNPAVQPSKTA
jgi:isopentenyldiphosphate isomerase